MEMELWLRADAAESSRKRYKKERKYELELELESLDWQAIDTRAALAGVSIYRAATVQGRFGGACGARKKVAEIRADIVAVESAREIDEMPSTCNGTSELVRTPGSHSIESTSSSEKKRPYADVESMALVSRDSLLTSKVCRKFHNRLAIVGSSPGSLCLGKASASTASSEEGL